MEVRPKIELELSTADKIFEIIGWLLVLAIWGLTIPHFYSSYIFYSRFFKIEKIMS
jgi:hypothetical protein